MNPPFGTKNNEGIDMELLKAATRALKSGGQLFSLHKASTRQYIEKYMQE
jgi:rRNA N6-adenosine-methyltransferase METTL5